MPLERTFPKEKCTSLSLLAEKARFVDYEVFDSLTRQFIENGEDVNTYVGLYTLLGIALTYQRNFPLAEYLITKGAKVNKLNYEKESPLILVIRDTSLQGKNAYTSDEDKLKMVQFLIEHGADPNKGKFCKTYRLIQLCILCNHTEIVKYLIQNGAKVGRENISNELSLAIDNRNNEIVRYLIDNKLININIKNQFKVTAVYRTIDIGNFELFKYFVDKGCNLKSLLFVCIRFGRYEMTEYLLKKDKKNINKKNKFGNTPLLLAIYYIKLNPEIPKLLLSYGANTNVKNKEGKTPLDLTLEIEDKYLSYKEELIQLINLKKN